MSGQGIEFDGGRELDIVSQEHPLLGSLIGRLIDALNRTSKNAGVSVHGQLPPPPPVDGTSVKVSGEILHFVHTHNASFSRGVQYITEIGTDPNFINPPPHPIDTGASRSGFVTLPTNDDNGIPVNYYLRVTPQYHGSQPGPATVFGGALSPTPITMAGTTNMTLLTSQSAGTAKPYQSGQGLGKPLTRTPVGEPKRSL